MDYESLAKVRAAELLLYDDPKKAAKDLYTKVMEIVQDMDPEYSKKMLLEYLKCAASVIT